MKILALLGPLVLACSGIEVPHPDDAPSSPGGTAPLRVAVRAAPAGMERLSPLSYRGGFQPKTLLYETLVRRDEDGRLVAGLAASWRFEVEGRVVVFTMRDGARFHDGATVDAEAVRIHFKRWVGLPEHGWLGANAHIVDVVARSERELAIVLDEPYALLPDLCAINPCAIRGPGALDAEGEFVKPVGTGPFRFVGKTAVAGTFRLEHRGIPLDLVCFGAESPRTPLDALLAGDVDVVVDGWTENIPRARLAELRANPAFDVFEGPGSSVWYLSFRLDGATGEPRVRRRIAAVVDRAELVERVEAGHADPCRAWAAPTVRTWPRGAPAPRSGTDDPLPTAPLLFPVHADSPRELALAAAVAEQLERASIPVQVVRCSGAEYGAAVEGGAYDLRLESTWGVPYDPYLSLRARFLPPAATPNAAAERFFGVDPRLTSLVQEASRVPDLEARSEVYGRIQALMDAEALLVPLLVPRRIGVVRAGLPPLRLDHDLYRTRFEDLLDA